MTFEDDLIFAYKRQLNKKDIEHIIFLNNKYCLDKQEVKDAWIICKKELGFITAMCDNGFKNTKYGEAIDNFEKKLFRNEK